MRLPKNMQQRLLTESRFAAKQMRAEVDIFRKLYFFSAFHGEIGRILNWSWDRDLVLLHTVLTYTHQQFSARLKAAVTGQDRVIDITDSHIEELTKVAERLVQFLEKEWDEGEFCAILGRLCELAYATTGNGNYLVERGVLKI